MSTKIQLTVKERLYLMMLLGAELQTKKERMLHAASHNTDFYDPDVGELVTILEKLDS